MGNGFNGSDFMYIGIGAAAIYAAYRILGPTNSGDAPSAIEPPSTTGGIFNGTDPTQKVVNILPPKVETEVKPIVDAVQTTGVKVSGGISNPLGVVGNIAGVPSYGAIFGKLTGAIASIQNNGLFGEKTPRVAVAQYVARPGIDYTPVPSSTPTPAAGRSSMYSTTAKPAGGSQSVTGKPVGYKFASGATVKSTGASGKYKMF